MSAIPNVRARDPLSSFLAADRALRFRQTHVERILDALKTHGASSAERLESLTGLTVVQIDRRLIEMQRAGQIRVVRVLGNDLMLGGFRVWEAI